MSTPSPPSPSTAAAAPFSPGGYLPPTPSALSHSPPPNTSPLHPPLPTPRPHRLPPRHTSALISYLDTSLLSITRQHTQHHTPDGYTSSRPLALALSKLVDVIWLANAPSITVQYLLNIANTFNDFLESYAVTVEALGLCDKLDRCFVGLVEGARGMDGTEKVRVRGVAERGRLHVGGMVGEGRVEEAEGEEEEWDGTEDGGEVDWEEEAGRVYVRTLEVLGGDLQEATTERAVGEAEAEMGGCL